MLVWFIAIVFLVAIFYFIFIHSKLYKNIRGEGIALRLLKKTYKVGGITKTEYFRLKKDVEESSEEEDE